MSYKNEKKKEQVTFSWVFNELPLNQAKVASSRMKRKERSHSQIHE